MTPADPPNTRAERRIWPGSRPPTPLHSRLATAPARLVSWFAALLAACTDKVGPRTIEGVHYRPLDLGSLSRRLTGAPGYADFAVTFPTGERMRIRATRDRAFADLLAETSGYPLRWLIDALPPLVRPGDRAIILGAGTGAITRAVADLVGPSGSVTALDPDAVSVAYARKRYPAEHIAHERGTHRSLDAEPDHAAEVILLTPLAAACPLEELWRILSPRGRLIAAAHHAGRLKALAADADIRILQLPHHAQTATPGEDRRIGVASRTPGA